MRRSGLATVATSAVQTYPATRSSRGGVAFLVVWTVGIVAIEAWNFRTMYLGRGRRAEALQRATDEPGAR